MVHMDSCFILELCICSSSNPWLSRKPTRSRFFNKRVVDSDHPLFSRWYLRNSCCLRFSILEDGNLSFSYRLVDFHKSRRTRCLLPFASADDGVTLNGSPQASSSSDLEEMRVKLDQSVQGEDYSTGLVQSLHDAARVFELAIKAQGSLSKSSWFSTAWLGVDKTAWIKALSYQVCCVTCFLVYGTHFPCLYIISLYLRCTYTTSTTHVVTF